VGLLHWARREGRVGEAQVGAFELGHVRARGRLVDADVLVAHSASLMERQHEVAEFFLVRADAVLGRRVNLFASAAESRQMGRTIPRIIAAASPQE
jgi:hypothetical protein